MNSIPEENKRNMNGEKKSNSKLPDTFDDGICSIKISEDMEIRNILRSGLVEAQGNNADKIPMYVSWPHWLEDGIVCLFVKDLHELIAMTAKNTALSLNEELGENTSSVQKKSNGFSVLKDNLPRMETGLSDKPDNEINSSGEKENKANPVKFSRIIKSNPANE